MASSRAILAVGVLASSVVGAPGPAAAFRCKVSERHEYVALRWPTRQLTYGVRAGFPAEVELLDVESAFGEWSEKSCTDLELGFEGVVSAGENMNQVVFDETGWVAQNLPPDAVGITLTTYALETGLIRRAEIHINLELFSFADVSEGCTVGTNTYDLIAVLTHEVGHFVGLDHTEAFAGTVGDPTMAPRVGECESDKRNLKADDVAGLCLLYPKDGPAGACTSLPEQAGPYVKSKPFGCRASGPVDPRPGSGSSALAVLGLWLLSRGRRAGASRLRLGRRLALRSGPGDKPAS